MSTRAPRSAAVQLVAGLVALVIAATLAAGCGAKAASAKGTTGERAETRAFAARVNLRRADLPGARVVLADEEGKPGPLDRGVETCDGGPRVNTAIHGRLSPLMQIERPPVQTLVSGVYRLASATDAVAYIKAADGPRGLRCIEGEETHKNATLSPGARGRVDVSALRAPLGAPTLSGVRVWKCLTGPQPCSSRQVRGFTDRIWFPAGRYVVALIYIVITTPPQAAGPAPVPLPLERRLGALLYRRTRPHATSVALRGLRTKSG